MSPFPYPQKMFLITKPFLKKRLVLQTCTAAESVRAGELPMIHGLKWEREKFKVKKYETLRMPILLQ